MVVLSSIEELFSRKTFTAVPDLMPPDTFNSGLMVFEPSKRIFDLMMATISVLPSYNGGDQGFLNTFFDNWYHLGPDSKLPYTYNTQTKIMKAFPPAWYLLFPRIKVLHFSPHKPWKSYPWRENFLQSRTSSKLDEVSEANSNWWNLFGQVPNIDYFNAGFFVQTKSLLEKYMQKIEDRGLRVGVFSTEDMFDSENVARKLVSAFARIKDVRHVKKYGSADEPTLVNEDLDLFVIISYHKSLPIIIESLHLRNPEMKIFCWVVNLENGKNKLYDIQADSFLVNSRVLLKNKDSRHDVIEYYLPPAGDIIECEDRRALRSKGVELGEPFAISPGAIGSYQVPEEETPNANAVSTRAEVAERVRSEYRSRQFRGRRGAESDEEEESENDGGADGNEEPQTEGPLEESEQISATSDGAEQVPLQNAKDKMLRASFMGDYSLETKTKDYQVLDEMLALGGSAFGSGWGQRYNNHPGVKPRWEARDTDLYLTSNVVVSVPKMGQKRLGSISPIIYEALACGTPVISPSYLALELALADSGVVFISRTQAETKKTLHYISSQNEKWFEDFRRKAQQFIVEGKHTYDDRAHFMIDLHRKIVSSIKRTNDAAKYADFSL